MNRKLIAVRSPLLLTTLIALTIGGIALPSGADNGVWGWGRNDSSQLGDGTLTARLVRVQMNNLAGIKSVRGGNAHSVVLRNDGTVWACGNNAGGQLGDGTNTNRSKPVQVVGLTGIVSISAGYGHNLAVRNDGTVWAWGGNSLGELGDNTHTNRNLPVQVIGLGGITAVAAGSDHSMALKNDGTVWCWGYNVVGQLGDGTKLNRNLPVMVVGLSTVTAIAAGYDSSFALLSGGTVAAWGWNNNLELGLDYTYISYPLPVNVAGVSGVTAIEAGGAHCLALRNDGTVWAWGAGQQHELGNADQNDHNVPLQVSGLTGVTAVAGGGGFSLALRSDGTVWAWGDNGSGQLGDGSPGYPPHAAPMQVIGLTGATAIAAAAFHSLAIAPSTDHAPTAYDQSVLASVNTATPITLTGFDPDADPLTYAVQSLPSHGQLSGTPPALTYTSTTGFSGSDTFTFIVNDGTFDSFIGTIAITVGVRDVTSQVVITRGGFRRAPNGHYVQSVSLRNVGSTTIQGPISLVLNSLSGNATLFNKTGVTVATLPAGSPYINATAGNLAAAATVTVTLEFTDPTNAAISYSTRVLAGAGSR
jgi:alpha-tubulin suppressor-like RCC1 family protein